MAPEEEYIPVDAEALKTLKHDIRNQLSNINLALEQLQYEIPEPTTDDCRFYLRTIGMSSDKIKQLLEGR